MKLHQLLDPYSYPLPSVNPEIQAIKYDSRQIQPGDLYVAIKGLHSDGHQFIPQVQAKGAAAVVVAADWATAHPEKMQADTPVIAVQFPRQALAELAAQFYGQPAQQLQMMGVTGTNGKTTTAWMISQLLQALGQPCGWIGTLGAGLGSTTYPGQYTTPFPPELHALLATLKQDGAQAVAMECSSHALEQHRLDQIPFAVGVFSNLTQDHLDYHQTMQAYAEAKSLLFSRLLSPTGLAVLNGDDPWCELMAAASVAPVLRFGFSKQADWQAGELELSPEGVSFALKRPAQAAVRLHSPITGGYNVLNLLAALISLQQLGYSLEQIMPHLPQLRGVPGRLERVSPDGCPFAVYVDYAHTPDSLENVLRTARQFTSGQLWAVFGCGGDRDKGKRPLMGALAEKYADRCVITSDNPRSEDPELIIQDILKGLVQPEKAWVAPLRQQAIEKVLAAAAPGDCVIIAGKGHENYQIIGSQVLDFDDRQVARQLLQA